jgi:hypothetical protein
MSFILSRGRSRQPMGRTKLRRLHVAVDPPVAVTIGDRRVSFLGVNLLNIADAACRGSPSTTPEPTDPSPMRQTLAWLK